MSQPTDDPANEPRLMTDIDVEEARLLVHIEPIDPADEDATDRSAASEGEPGDHPGLAE